MFFVILQTTRSLPSTNPTFRIVRLRIRRLTAHIILVQLREKRGDVEHRVLVILVRAFDQSILSEKVEETGVDGVGLAEKEHVVEDGSQNVDDRLEILSILVAKIDRRSHMMNGEKRHFAANLQGKNNANRDLLAERRLGDDLKGSEKIANKFGQHGHFTKQNFQRCSMIEHDFSILLSDVDPRIDPRFLVFLSILLDRFFARLNRAVLLFDSRVEDRVLHHNQAKQHEKACKKIAALLRRHIDHLLAAQLAMNSIERRYELIDVDQNLQELLVQHAVLPLNDADVRAALVELDKHMEHRRDLVDLPPFRRFFFAFGVIGVFVREKLVFGRVGVQSIAHSLRVSTYTIWFPLYSWLPAAITIALLSSSLVELRYSDSASSTGEISDSDTFIALLLLGDTSVARFTDT